MKTKNTISAISFMLTFILLTTLSFAKGKGDNPKPFWDDKKFVTYVVDIAAEGLEQELNGYMVIMTDGNGKTIAPSQPYIPGISSYIFREAGPTDGIRIARLEKMPHTFGPDIHFRSAYIHGPFESGLKYNLLIVPDSNAEGNATGITN